jgi:hypothetical protein
MRFGNSPTIYADLSCAECGASLKREAGSRLVVLFSSLHLPPENKRLLRTMVFFWVGAPLLLTFVIWAGSQAGLWSARAFIGLVGLNLLIWPSILFFNLKVASLRQRCECGQPRYLFMGLLGRAYCYRCSSCGKLMRVRD